MAVAAACASGGSLGWRRAKRDAAHSFPRAIRGRRAPIFLRPVPQPAQRAAGTAFDGAAIASSPEPEWLACHVQSHSELQVGLVEV